MPPGDTCVSVTAQLRLYAVVRPFLTTILPGSGRPTYCLGGGIGRYSVGYDEVHNCGFFDANIEPNDGANDCRNNSR